jgi:hypothetical protein
MWRFVGVLSTFDIMSGACCTTCMDSWQEIFYEAQHTDVEIWRCWTLTPWRGRTVAR